jgi:geranylgeranyl diphosphate synthase type II
MDAPYSQAFDLNLKRYCSLVDQGLSDLGWDLVEPSGLYAPMHYFMGLGGKRLRPALCLMACEMAGGEAQAALPQALALELFHNFTLLHDDVMDESPLRRGQPTVHLRFGLNAAILSGDALLIEAYSRMVQARPELLPDLLREFNRVALQVCQGQQMDMDFQNREEVGLEEYREMIGLKTAVLLGSSLKIGAMMGGASVADAQAVFRVGYLTGLAFQVQDDWLDVYGDPARFGKQIAGDIKACKHNFLRVLAWEHSNDTQKGLLLKHFARIKQLICSGTAVFNEEVFPIIRIYDQIGVTQLADNFKENCLKNIQNIVFDPSFSKSDHGMAFYEYCLSLINRDF